MIRFIKGQLAHKSLNTVVLDRDGIGFEIYVPGNSQIYLKNEGDEVKLFTEMIVREDDISLYGFSNMEELSLFKLLITVSGVGAKAALAIFSVTIPMDIKKAIMYDDIDVLTRASGVGKKTAQRIVLELKDKVGCESFAQETSGGEILHATMPKSNKNDAIEALIELGYPRNEATKLIENVSGEDLSVEDYIKSAFRKV
ncbi:MAG: Holliday junction branch migration protein RuvA [Anaerovoracaceae bacterium]